MCFSSVLVLVLLSTNNPGERKEFFPGEQQTGLWIVPLALSEFPSVAFYCLRWSDGVEESEKPITALTGGRGASEGPGG